MENRVLENGVQYERTENRVEDLHLDNVVASHPQIGPTPPDGGYGWLIVAASSIYHITVPSLFTLYGFIIFVGLKRQDLAENETIKVWDADVALVPVIMLVIKLMLESWCRALVATFNVPRLIAISGLCLTVAGVLLSSYSVDVDSNDHILDIFAGIFIGMGSALTGQQIDVLVSHYFRDKLTTAQRIVRMAPSYGYCIMPMLVGFLCSTYESGTVIMIYAAIIMQNSLFLVSFTRPVYTEVVPRPTYNMLADNPDDDDRVIFSNQNGPIEQGDTSNIPENIEDTAQDEDINDVVVFKSKKNAKEILDPEVQYRDKGHSSSNSHSTRFSSDFSTMEPGVTRFSDNPNRFSSNFGSQDVYEYNRVNGYQELDDIDSRNPQPLYRETTVNTPQDVAVFPDASPGTVRRTASLKKNVITIISMLMDANFYLYATLHLSTTFSIMVLGLFFPTLVWEATNQSANVWSVSTVVAIAHATALCFTGILMLLPQNVNEKGRLSAIFSFVGAVGFFGITITRNRGLLVLWGMLASFSSSASTIFQPTLANSSINQFDSIATNTATNLVASIFIMSWSLARNYDFVTCFSTACILQGCTTIMFLVKYFFIVSRRR